MNYFDLKLRISFSDKEFIELLGNDRYSVLKEEIFKQDNFTCQGCGYKPVDMSKIYSILSMHIIELNNEIPEESKCTCLCKACHITQHIDVAVKKGWVKLVNSSFSQKSLIEMCRINATLSSLNDDNTRYLKISPEEFIQKIKNNALSKNSRAKILFTSNFDWGLL